MRLDFATLQSGLALITAIATINVSPALADIQWPEYSQACREEAGPPFADDAPGTYYHEGSAAYPKLINGECADPLKQACNDRPDAKTAYLEGPISCGDKGWYCRIFEEDGWPAESLPGDVNFGECNKAESFEDDGYDRDGHCHGSSHDDVYYWWIRDHWFRQYNGRVRCCCGWFEGGTQPIYSGRIANRCDYRRQVAKGENLNQCRDANEDHGMGFDNVGCDRQYEGQIGSPIPEDDSVCWEINRFGYSERPPPPPVTPPTPPPVTNPVTPPTPPPVNPPVETPTDPPVRPPVVKCTDSKSPFYINGRRKKCNWVRKNKEDRCGLEGMESHCPKSCRECRFYKCKDSDLVIHVRGEGRITCDDVMEEPGLCDIKAVKTTCRETCGYCD